MGVVSTQQAADKYGLNVETIRRWARQGLLKTMRIGRVYVIDEADLARVMEHPPQAGRPRKEKHP